MLYILIRFIIFFIFSLAILFMYKFKKVKKIICLIFEIIILILFSISYLLPFENAFYTFGSSQEAINYITRDKIIGSLEGENSTMIITRKNNIYSQYILPKTNTGWKIETSLSYKKIVSKYCENKIVTVYKYKNSDDYYIIIMGLIVNYSENVSKISDNKNSYFEYYEDKISNDSKTLIYFAHVNDFENNYEININDTIYKLY